MNKENLNESKKKFINKPIMEIKKAKIEMNSFTLKNNYF